jgi:hypothetical protein
MKKIIAMLVIVAWATSLAAQITREQADAIVQNHLQNEAAAYELYVNVNTPTAEGISITTSNEETFKAKYACWTYYLSEGELSRCRYLFVKANNGNLLEVIANNDVGQSDTTQWKSMDDDPVGWVEWKGNTTRPLIYPNPVDDWLTLSYIGERTQIEIHDIKGVRLYSGILSRESLFSIGEGSGVRLDVSFLSAGVYLVSVYGEAKVVYKIIKK